MEVTLLGSGEAVGVPAPLCNCRYCEQSSRRRRPGLLIETESATIVLDAGPEIKEQLQSVDASNVDGFFITHHHFDHVGGLHELGHAAMGFDEHVGIEGEYLPTDTFAEEEKPEDPSFAVYLTETALAYAENANAGLVESLNPHTIEHGRAVEIGDLRVVPFPVQHSRPQFDTLGFAVYHEETKVVYAPDMWEFMGDTEYSDADLFFAEGAALFRAFGHGEESDLRSALRAADAKHTVLINLNEHLQRMTTEEMQTAAAQDGYELGEDFATYQL